MKGWASQTGPEKRSPHEASRESVVTPQSRKEVEDGTEKVKGPCKGLRGA